MNTKEQLLKMWIAISTALFVGVLLLCRTHGQTIDFIWDPHPANTNGMVINYNLYRADLHSTNWLHIINVSTNRASDSPPVNRFFRWHVTAVEESTSLESEPSNEVIGVRLSPPTGFEPAISVRWTASSSPMAGQQRNMVLMPPTFDQHSPVARQTANRKAMALSQPFGSGEPPAPIDPALGERDPGMSRPPMAEFDLIEELEWLRRLKLQAAAEIERLQLREQQVQDQLLGVQREGR